MIFICQKMLVWLHEDACLSQQMFTSKTTFLRNSQIINIAKNRYFKCTNLLTNIVNTYIFEASTETILGNNVIPRKLCVL